MSAISDYLENELLEATLRGGTYTGGTVYVALFTTAPTDSDSGTEIGASEYERQSIVFGSPQNGEISNVGEVLFPIANTAWGEITHIGLYDAQTNGNLLYHGALNVSKTIGSGSQFKIPDDYFHISLS